MYTKRPSVRKAKQRRRLLLLLLLVCLWAQKFCTLTRWQLAMLRSSSSSRTSLCVWLTRISAATHPAAIDKRTDKRMDGWVDGWKRNRHRRELTFVLMPINTLHCADIFRAPPLLSRRCGGAYRATVALWRLQVPLILPAISTPSSAEIKPHKIDILQLIIVSCR